MIHSLALSHSIRAWQLIFGQMKPGVSNVYLQHV